MSNLQNSEYGNILRTTGMGPSYMLNAISVGRRNTLGVAESPRREKRT